MADDEDEYESGKVTMSVRKVSTLSPNGKTKTTDIYLKPSRGSSRAQAGNDEFNPSAWKDDGKNDDIILPAEEKLVIPPEDDDSGSDFGDSEDDSRAKVPQKFEGEFKWDGFEEAQQLSEQNNQLLFAMDQKDKEIDKLNVLIRAIEPVPGLDPEKFLDVMQGSEMVDQDYRDAKIIEMAKKNKSVSVELGKAKGGYNRMKDDLERTKTMLAEAQDEIEKLSSPAARAAARNSSNRQTSKNEEGKSPKKAPEVAQMKKKLADTQMKLDRSNAEAKKLKRFLSKEVGEDIDINTLSEDKAGWRGRAQQIVMLRTKVKRLEAERSAAIASATNPNFKSNRNRNDVDLRAAEEIQDMEQQRRDAMEQITMENKRLLEEVGKVQNKFEASRARTHVLENENKKQLGQVKTLLDKTGMDDQLVDALRAELEKTRKLVRRLQHEKQQAEASAHSSMVATGSLPLADPERERLDRQVSSQASRIEAQDRLVSHLRAELKQLRDSGAGGSKPRRPTSQETRTRARQSQKIVEAERTLAENRALHVETSRLKELSGLLRDKLAEAEQETEELRGAVSTLSNKNTAMKRQMGGRQSRERNDPSSAVALREKLMAQEEENKAIRESFRSALANSEQELELVRKMANETKAVYERSLAEIQEQLQQDNIMAGVNAFNSAR